MGCDDDGGSDCDSSAISGTWDMYSLSKYPLGCIGECFDDCEPIDNETTSHSDSQNDLKIQNDCNWGQYKEYDDGWEEAYRFILTEIDIDTFEICPHRATGGEGSCFLTNKIADDTLLFMIDDISLPDSDTNYCGIVKYYLR